MEFQSCLLKVLLDRGNEVLYVFVASLLGSREFVLDVIVGIVLKIFEGEVFEFAFKLIEPQFMCEWCIKVARLFGCALTCSDIGSVAYLTHEVDAIGYHNKYHAHILSKGEKQRTKILSFYGWGLFIELLHTVKSVEDRVNSTPILPR